MFSIFWVFSLFYCGYRYSSTMYEGTGTGTEGSRVQFLILKKFTTLGSCFYNTGCKSYWLIPLSLPSEIKIPNELAREFGADYSVNIKDKTNEQVSHEIKELTHGRGIDVILDTVGLGVTTQLGFDILAKRGALVLVGLFGKQINIPAFLAVANEYQFYGSLWGNYNELAKVIELAEDLGKLDIMWRNLD